MRSSTTSSLPKLSPREREVLSVLATGADSRSIAERLFLSEHTVNDHVKAVLAKTGSANVSPATGDTSGGRVPEQ